MLSHQELRELSSEQLEEIGIKRENELKKQGHDSCTFDAEFASIFSAYIEVKRKEMAADV